MKIINVAVGVVINASNEILIAKRAAHQHQGNLWEFPGGKIEDGESTFIALQREFQEEVNINCLAGKPLIIIEHDYGDKQVNLDTWLINEYTGDAQGLEGQAVQWVHYSRLTEYTFPAANQAIIKAIIDTVR